MLESKGGELGVFLSENGNWRRAWMRLILNTITISTKTVLSILVQLLPHFRANRQIPHTQRSECPATYGNQSETDASHVSTVPTEVPVVQSVTFPLDAPSCCCTIGG